MAHFLEGVRSLRMNNQITPIQVKSAQNKNIDAWKKVEVSFNTVGANIQKALDENK